MEDAAFRSYIAEVQRHFKSGVATEHTYRPALIEFLKSIADDDYEIFNEPRRVNCGAPDILLSESGLPLGHIETKDLGADLDDIEDSEQIVRYKKALPNLIVTNYLEFRWYVEGNLRDKFCIAELKNKKFVQSKEMISGSKVILEAFLKVRLPVITSSSALAKRMAGLAQLIRYGIKKALRDSDKGGNLFHQLSSFKTILLPSLDEDEFADLYAQTLPYGLFTARLNMTNSVLHRETASYAIPKSNPFLRRIFLNLAGPDLEDRVVWVVEDLVNLMNRVDFNALAEDFRHGQNTADPIIHFYETFLQAYDSDSRKSRGVYYTPLPIVNFIVRGVDQLLKKKFEIIDGLADDTRLTLVKDKKKKEYHRVTVLDPATGTGTFLNQSIKFLKNQFVGNEGLWADYLKENVVPRFFGFEFLMTPYILAHMKLGIETEVFSKEASEEERLNIYLTNTLDEPKATGQLFPFARWLSEEATAANEVKKSAPVMVVMGNPPYAVSSQNKSDWINELVKDYKTGLNEKKLNLDDDYIKFMKFAQWRIEQTGQGVIAMITNHSFIEGITHRRMRESLLESFDEIYILDLHGNAVKATETPDGRKDENVFEIKQGVSINFLIRNNTKTKKYGQIFHCDVWGSKQEKYDLLDANSWESLTWTPIEVDEKYFFFVPTSHDSESDYTKFLSVNEIFVVGSSGIQTKRDPLFVDDSADALAERWEEILGDPTATELHEKYPLYESPGWSVKKLDSLEYSNENIHPYWFRPFDKRFIYYDPQALGRARDKVMKHFLNENLGIVTYRQTVDDGFRHVSFVDGLADINLVTNHHVSDRIYPGFLYEYWDLPENEAKTLQASFAENGKAERVPNISEKFIKHLKTTIGVDLVNDITGSNTTCGVADVMSYVFAVLNSTEYRTTYWDWLKIEFPRVPLPKNKEIFWEIVEIGRRLTELVSFQNIVTRTEYIGKFPVEGSGKVQKLSYKDNKIFINAKQYFDDVPVNVWNYSVGGYQVCEKWLKERKSFVLSSDSIREFQKLLTHVHLVLESVSKLDSLISELGGWQAISAIQRPVSANVGQIFDDSTQPAHIRDRLGLACLIVDAHEKKKLGRVKLAKIFYLLDQYASLDLKTEYYREAAGPVALQAIYGKTSGIEALGIKEGLFETSESILQNKRKIVTYKKIEKISSAIEYIKYRLGSSWDTIHYKLETLAKLNSVQTEIVATLFACWNDLLLQKKKPTDDEIISEFRDNWSDRKKLFSPLRLKNALLWMKKNDFIPEGKGPKTKIRF